MFYLIFATLSLTNVMPQYVNLIRFIKKFEHSYKKKRFDCTEIKPVDEKVLLFVDYFNTKSKLSLFNNPRKYRYNY